MLFALCAYCGAGTSPVPPFPPVPAYHEEGYSGWVVVVSVRTAQWLGWVTKNGRTRGEIGVNVSGQPKRRRRLARIWRTGSKRTESIRRTDVAMRQKRGVDP